MTKIELLEKLNVNRFCKENNIKYLGLFGSYARDEQKNTSDVDFLFEVDNTTKVTLFGIGKMIYTLQKELGIDVDFVDRGNLRPEFQPSILNDLVTLYEQR